MPKTTSFSLSNPKLSALTTRSSSPTEPTKPAASNSSSSVDTMSATSTCTRQSTDFDSVESFPKEIIYSDKPLSDKDKTRSSIDGNLISSPPSKSSSIPNMRMSLPSLSSLPNPLAKKSDYHTHSRHASDSSNKAASVPNSSALYVPLRAAVLDRVLATDPAAVVNEYSLTPGRDGTKKITTGSETLERVAAFGLRKFLSVMGGKEHLNDRWEDLKTKGTVRDVDAAGKGVHYPDVLLASTSWKEVSTKAGAKDNAPLVSQSETRIQSEKNEGQALDDKLPESAAGFRDPAIFALELPDGVGKLPALGWNSWNAYHCDVDEDKIMAAANSVVGLENVAQFFEVDDCWSVKAGRDNVTQQIIPNSTTFPDGIDGLAAKIHDLGLKIGIYSSAGTETCAGYPASIFHESIDAATFADWGIDYLKYDNCNVPSNVTDEYSFCIADPDDGEWPADSFSNGTCTQQPASPNPPLAPAGYDWTTSNTYKRYAAMRDALGAQNRTILFSLCAWGHADVQDWSRTVGQSFRMSGDIQPTWERITAILNLATFLASDVEFSSHPDMDMLELGNDITIAESRSHFALWAAMKSPLIIGTDLSALDNDSLDILKNPYLLSFNQDSALQDPVRAYKWGRNVDWTWDPTYPAEYYAGQTSKNETLVLMLNTDNATTSVNKTADFAEVPGLEANGTYNLTDVWTGQNLGCVTGDYTVAVAAHDTAALWVKDNCS
ncbi:MAG: hypothetical protein Q9227_001694 [Pyrenula ochraceoflavens]